MKPGIAGSLLAAALCAGCGGGATDTDSQRAAPQAVVPAQLQATSDRTLSQQYRPSAVPSAIAVSYEQLMDWAERSVPELNHHADTLKAQGLVFRYYSASDTYLIITDDGSIMLLRPRLSSQPAYIGSAGQYFCALAEQIACAPMYQVALPGYYWAPGDYVIRNQDQWSQAWAENRTHFPTERQSGLPPEQPPTVILTNYMLVGVSLGAGTDCGAFHIARVIEEKAALRVEYSILPTPHYSCAAVISPIYRFVAVPQSDKPVSFVNVTL